MLDIVPDIREELSFIWKHVAIQILKIIRRFVTIRLRTKSNTTIILNLIVKIYPHHEHC